MRLSRGVALASALLVAAILAGCDSLPGHPTEAERPLRPTDVKDFAALYRGNCAGCHGPDGKSGAALPLNNPVYVALVDDLSLRRAISRGVAGTAMPPFAISDGGELTDDQVDILAAGIRTNWAGSGAPASGAPPYSASSPGDASVGSRVYTEYCAACHGADGAGGNRAGSIVDRSFLSLVSDQNLRTITIAGRPDLDHPNWQTYVAGKPMTAEQVSDVVAWLASKRPAAVAANR